MGTPETSLRQRHADLTRELILRTVADMLEQDTASDLSVPEVARRSGVSLRTVYRHFPTREELLAAAGEWIGANILRAKIPKAIAEVPQVYAENAALWDAHPNLVEAMALTRGANSGRSIRRRERLEKLREALREVTDGLPEDEARQAFAVFAYLNSMLAWVTMREDAGLDGKQVGAAVAWAMRVLIDDLRRRQRAAGTSGKGKT